MSDEFDESKFDNATLGEAAKEVEYQRKTIDALLDALIASCKKEVGTSNDPKEIIAAVRKVMPEMGKETMKLVRTEVIKRYNQRH